MKDLSVRLKIWKPLEENTEALECIVITKKNIRKALDHKGISNHFLNSTSTIITITRK